MVIESKLHDNLYLVRLSYGKATRLDLVFHIEATTQVEAWGNFCIFWDGYYNARKKTWGAKFKNYRDEPFALRDDHMYNTYIPTNPPKDPSIVSWYGEASDAFIVRIQPVDIITINKNAIT